MENTNYVNNGIKIGTPVNLNDSIIPKYFIR